MAINFPNNPIHGNTYEYASVKYSYKDTGSGKGFWRTITADSGPATSAELDAGTNTDKYATPASLQGSKYSNLGTSAERDIGTEPSQIPLNSQIPISSTSVKGLVKLTNSVSSTSTTTAATPSSVKSAYEQGGSGVAKANAAQSTANAALVKSQNLNDLTNKATARDNLGSSNATNLTAGTVPEARLVVATTSVKGISQLSTSVSSTSTSLSATASAARTAYNRGSLGVSKADTAQAKANAALVKSSNLSDLTSKSTARVNLQVNKSGTTGVESRNNDQNDDRFVKSRLSLSGDLNNLNSADDIGEYNQNSTSNATTANHYPINEAGTLVVSIGVNVLQTYTSYSSHRVFTRSYYSNVWQNWSKQARIGTGNSDVRSNLELDARFLLESNNLSDLTSKGTARTSLEVLRKGTASTEIRQNSLLDSRYVIGQAGTSGSQVQTNSQNDTKFIKYPASAAEVNSGANAAKFVTPSSLKGSKYEDALGYLVPSGLITMWYGSIASVPAGWKLCDGANGTPDLRDRFVVGAGARWAPADVGGSANASVVSHSHSASSGSAGSHSHTGTAASAGSHNHTGSTNTTGNHAHTATTSSKGSHNHSGTTSSNGNHNHSGSTNSTGAHTHSQIYHKYQRPGNQKNRDSSDTSGVYKTQNTGSAGNHSHSLSINSNGNHDHTMTTNTVADHNHTLTTNTTGNHSHSLSINDNGSHGHNISTSTVGNHAHSVAVNSAGSSGTDKNLPPFYALAYIMKT
jgi:hypothetical protein